MSRGKIIIISLLVLFVVGALTLGGAALGYLAYRERQTEQWLAEATEAFEQGDWQEARSRYQWYLPRRGDDIDALENFAYANLQIVEGRRSSLQRAATAYHQILRHAPDRTEIEDELLDLYVKQRSWPTVEYYAREYLQRRPGDERLRKLLARALAGAGRGADAVDEYMALVQDGVTDAQMLRELIDLLRDRDETTRAARVLDEVLEQNPSDAGVRAARAYFYAAQRNWDAMEAELSEGLALDPEHPFVLQMQAQYGVATQQYNVALEYGERALEIDPESAQNYTLLAHVYSRLGQNERALELLSGVDPIFEADNPEILMALVELQIGMGLYDEAADTRERYARINPGQRPIVDYMEAREMLARGDAEEAAQILTTVSELRPGFTPARFYLALAHLTAGNTTRGRNLLESYVSQNPTDERAQALLRQETGGSMSLDEQISQVQMLLAQDTSTSEALVSSALMLFDTASIAGVRNEHEGLIIDLLNRAIERDSANIVGYRGLAEVYAVMGDFEDAHDVIERAAGNGVPEQELHLSRASIALSEGEPETAMAFFNEFHGDSDISAAEVVRWGTLFSRKGFADTSLQLIEQSMESFDDEDQLLLSLERARIAARADRFDDALEWVEDVAAQVGDASRLSADLNTARLDIAERLLQRGTASDREQRAEALISAVLETNPSNARALTLTGEMMLASADPDIEGAEAVFSDVLSTDPDSAGAHLGMARVALSRGATGQAASHLERAVMASPDIPWYRLQLAEVYVRLNRHTEARRLLRRVLDDQPLNPVALELMVSSLLAMNDTQEAQRYLDTLATLTVDDPSLARRVDALRGGMLVAAGDSEGAIALLEEQHFDEPDDLGIVQNLTVALANADRIDDAVELLRDYVERNDSDPDGWVALGRALIRRNQPGDLIEAARVVTRALVLEPDYLPAMREQIELQIRRGNDLQALTLCDRYLSRDPNDAGVLAHRARLTARDPNAAEEAIETASRVLELEERADMFYLRGSLLFSQGEYDAALSDLRRLNDMQSRTPANVDLMIARSYIQTGRRDLASFFFESAERKAAEGDAIDSALRETVGQDLAGST